MGIGTPRTNNSSERMAVSEHEWRVDQASR
jgi:hypothetical protein